MSAFAAVMTGQGTGAISTIEVFGDTAAAVVEKIFKSAGSKPALFETGRILLGTIVDGNETLDQVIIGCEGPQNIAINCHGNPLIVEMIMQLLQRHGVTLVKFEELLAKTLIAKQDLDTIALEAKLTQPKARTIEGTKIIINQIDGGLSKITAEWLESMNTMSLNRIKADATRILEDSQTAKLIIGGCAAAIIGPPNTGKSTLLNCLCGKQKAIVTDIRGTTRDWVSARCKIAPLSVELIDTAGLDEELVARPESPIEEAAQQKTAEILKGADLVLLVLDNNQMADQLDEKLIERIAGKKVLTVLSKTDLPARFDTASLPQVLRDTVQVSAKLETGIEAVLKKIPQICGAAGFDLKSPVCITDRQESLLRQLQEATSKEEATAIITELLNGRLTV
ncbi:MAG: GTPase [Planctomycetota bacterium]|jgi:tRNA modification GTPase